MKKYLLISFLLILGLLLSACSSSDLSDGTDDGTGTFALFLADKPVNNVDKVLVTISEVQVKKTDTQWETINDFSDTDGELEFDLMQLRFNETLLGQQMLAAGNYEQIRLIVAADENGKGNGNNSGKSRVVYQDGSEDDEIFIPSGTQTGLKISHNFTIQDGIITRLVLDADVSKIMHVAGNSGKIILRSTAIDVINKIISGNIEGRILADNGEGIYEPITKSDVVIEAIQNGQVIKSTVALAEDHTEETIDGDVVTKLAGTFFLRGLPEGTYSLKAYVVNTDSVEDNTTYQSTTIENVNVIAEQTNVLENDVYLEKTITTGSIEGNIVADTDNDGAYKAITTSEVVVEAIQNETVISTVTAPANDSNTANHFKVNDLEEGTYSLKVYTVDSNGVIDESTYIQTLLENISVTAGSNNILVDDIILERVTVEQPQ